MQSVLVVNDSGVSYYSPFASFGKKVGVYNTNLLEKSPDEFSLVVFTGGADVSPEIYGEEMNNKTYCSPNRDKVEKKIFELAVKLGKPIVGICRGSQFICAMSGGKLVQHLDGHGRWHTLKTDDNREIFVSSTHHQMQLPPEDAVPVAWAEPRLSDVYEGAPGVSYKPDLEHDVVWYPKTNALGIQYHPEFMDTDSEGFKYPAELIKRFFNLPVVN